MEINCDLGESLIFLENGLDNAFMQYVDAINVACTFHAGSKFIIEKTIEAALERNIYIGFHPSFDDFENFGRKEIDLSFLQIKNIIYEQYLIIKPIADRLGANIRHLKPHGALYNMAAKNDIYAHAIAEATFEIDPKLIVLGLSGSLSISEAEKLGLSTQNEVFADRAYNSDGQLVSRNSEGAIHQDLEKIKRQALAFKERKEIETSDSQMIKLKAETICVHSDTPDGLEIAKLLHQLLHEKK
jgi:5-oxoprolinase (ATP-hydrolysing) subunit A